MIIEKDKSKDMCTAWLKDPRVFRVNRLHAVSSHAFYRNDEEMKQGKSAFIQKLNGYWKFHYATSLQDVPAGFYKPDYDCSNWEEIQVPGHIQLQGYGTPMYVNQIYPWSGREQILPGEIPQHNPVGSYVTYFDSEDLPENTEAHIVFHGAESAIAVWVNGQFVGYSEDSFTPSAFDIHSFLVKGKNKLAVNVYRYSSGSWLEDQDFWRFSGIFRDVELQCIPCVHVQDVHITTQLNETCDRAEVKVVSEITSSVEDYEVHYSIYDGTDCVAESEGDGADFTIDNPKLWSAEYPHLYTLYIHVRQGDTLIEVVRQKFGIRQLSMKNGILCINGKRIVFHGVDRHEFCAESGRVVSYETTLKDIQTMKANNINAIRTSHYPNQTFLYDLCDEYGLYVIDEVNMETHGTWSELYDKQHILPDDKEEWLNSIVDRAESMVERDKNHPCIVLWSCGNESYGGKDIYEMSEFIRKKDPTRFVHYEGISMDPRYPETSDVISRMYTPAREIEEMLEKGVTKPFILCEYAHSMGNSNGALYKYTDLEEKYASYQGGFIWDYVDQALYHDGKLCYGGDFAERPSDYDFCGNGIVFADRTSTPKMQEVKYCYQYVRMHIDEAAISIKNTYLFTDLKEFTFTFTLYADGKETERKEEVIACAPGETVTVKNPYTVEEAAEEKVLVVRMIREGHVFAHEQYVYPHVCTETHVHTPLTITEDYLNVGVHGEGWNVIFSKQKGLVSYKVHGKEFIRVPVHPHFYRAATNNDVENQYGFRYGEWLQASLYAKCTYVRTEKEKEVCRIYYAYTLPNTKEKVQLHYEVYGDGEIVLDLSVNEIRDRIEMPQFGVLLETYPDLNQVTYYGYGPQENYVDRKKGAVLGKYAYTVEKNLTPYLYPQECGNRTGVRSFTLSSSSHALHVRCEEMEFSALPYTPYVLENARHAWELPVPYETVLTISSMQMGVAGDNTWGARTHPEFLLKKDAHHLRVSLKGE